MNLLKGSIITIGFCLMATYLLILTLPIWILYVIVRCIEAFRHNVFGLPDSDPIRNLAHKTSYSNKALS